MTDDTQPTPSDVLSHVQDSDVVRLMWPDGGEILAKGDAILQHMLDTKTDMTLRVCQIPVASTEEAEVILALARVIEDGGLHLDAEAKFCQMLIAARRKAKMN